jgi:murein DD-endopeptidase MepM/ murein hydrolase activator NlpD
MSSYNYPLMGTFPVSSGIGPRWGSTHGGIDIAAPIGTPVIAPTDITITRATIGSTGGYGNVVYGVDAAQNQYRFAHLDTIGVNTGDILSRGSILGTVGNTGRSTGPHLHFEVRDKAGRLLKDLTQGIVSGGIKGAVNKVSGVAGKLNELAGTASKIAALANPATAPFAAMGLIGGDGCGIVCQIKKWLEETDFIKRAGFVLVGIILIAGAIAFFARGEAQKVVQEIIKT